MAHPSLRKLALTPEIKQSIVTQTKSHSTPAQNISGLHREDNEEDPLFKARDIYNAKGLLAVYESAVARTKGRPNGPTELPTRAELAFQRSTRRLSSEFERVEEYLSQRSNNTPVSTRGSRSRGRARGSSLAGGHDPLITASQVANEEETAALDAFYTTAAVRGGPGALRGELGDTIRGGTATSRGIIRGGRGPAYIQGSKGIFGSFQV